jgi:hypothetical protein
MAEAPPRRRRRPEQRTRNLVGPAEWTPACSQARAPARSSTALSALSAPLSTVDQKPPSKDAALLVSCVRRRRRHRCRDVDDTPQIRVADRRKQSLLLLAANSVRRARECFCRSLVRLQSKIMIGECQRTGIAVVDRANSACFAGIESAVLELPAFQTESLGHGDSNRSLRACTALTSDKSWRRWSISSGVALTQSLMDFASFAPPIADGSIGLA